ncbi:AraC-type DNA-binding protein [Dyadobacter soli]|uniref:AraC-type DNA-binding protein n=1 Tax=Dyadobacter soli TaxID=659014 RepID=A0A1G7MEH6_9BACT|nr:AraC family transcriptional regulator [Dyadobacter soli]SDF59529.1 AraC-type DNA-binding protein [Dyadobacter soli]
MKIEILNKEGEVIESSILTAPKIACPTYRKTAYSVHQTYWTSSVTEIRAGQCHIDIHEINVKEQVSLKTYAAPAMMGMLFLEKGNIHVKQSDRSFRELGNLQHNLIYNAKQTEQTLFRPNQQIRLTIIHISPEYFFNLAEGGSNSIDGMASNIDRGDDHLFATPNNLQITFPMLRLLHSLDSNMYNPASLRLLTEARVMELLSLQIAQIEDNPRSAILSKLSDGDVKRINQAREYILSDVSFTPTLESIAMQVGINIYKLKTGFKALFGHSIFSYLREERLLLAYSEILTSDRSLTDIAYQTGFASISHFSDSFKNRYGISPSQLR